MNKLLSNRKGQQANKPISPHFSPLHMGVVVVVSFHGRHLPPPQPAGKG